MMSAYHIGSKVNMFSAHCGTLLKLCLEIPVLENMPYIHNMFKRFDNWVCFLFYIQDKFIIWFEFPIIRLNTYKTDNKYL